MWWDTDEGGNANIETSRNLEVLPKGWVEFSRTCAPFSGTPCVNTCDLVCTFLCPMCMYICGLKKVINAAWFTHTHATLVFVNNRYAGIEQCQHLRRAFLAWRVRFLCFGGSFWWPLVEHSAIDEIF